MAYGDQYGLDVRTARIFNSYGPRLRAEGFYGRVVSRFLLQALKGEDLTVFGDGSQTRSPPYRLGFSYPRFRLKWRKGYMCG